MAEKGKITTVTIGIPAYNEEANIGYLLEEIMNQVQNIFLLEKIIVASDGSTDGTVAVVQGCKDERISLIANSQRKGVSFVQNQIIDCCSSDILVLLNADIKINDPLFLEKFINPIIHGSSDLVSCLARPVPAKNFIERSLESGAIFKNRLFKNLRSGNNVYTCCGLARAFSKRLYANFHFEGSVGEDAYSYFYCKYHNFSYAYLSDAKVYFKLPDTLADHRKQSNRFNQSKKQFIELFGKEFIDDEYALPAKIMIREMLILMSRSPFYTVSYFCIVFLTKIMKKNEDKAGDKWEISGSSKKLRFEAGFDQPRSKSAVSIALLFRNLVYAFLFYLEKFNVFWKNRVIVLCYHSVSEEDWRFSVDPRSLEKQMSYLLERYDPITASDVERFIKGVKEITRPSFVIAFDDGYKDILKTKEYFRKIGIKPIVFALSDSSNVSRSEIENDKDFLSISDLLELKRAGWEIGCHGATHADFSKLDEAGRKREIADSKFKLEKELGFEIKYFAYPKGEYSRSILEEVESAGYKMAFSMDDNFVSRGTNIFSVSRIGIDKTHSFPEFKAAFATTTIVFRRCVKYILSLKRSVSRKAGRLYRKSQIN